MAECGDKNMIDKDEYPQTAELERRCVNILADLWNAPDGDDRDRLLDDRLERGLHARRAGAEVALARRREAAGKADRQAEPRHGRQRPGLLGEVLPLLGRRGARSCRWSGDATPPRRRRRRPRRATRTRSASSPSSARPSTASTSRSPRSAAALDKLQARDGPGHPGARRRRVAAASSRRSSTRTWCGTSGSPRVQSINTSGHKYGLVYPGVGWVLWRDADAAARGAGLPRQLPGRRHADLRAQLLAPGRAGRGAVLQLPAARPRRLPARAAGVPRHGALAGRSASASSAPSSWSPRAASCRCFAFRLRDDDRAATRSTTSPRQLRERGWLVPAYRMPPEHR